MTIPGLEGHIPEAQLDRLQLGRTEETVQPLLDLGYLPERYFQLQAHEQPRHLRQALDAFREECVLLPAITDLEVPPLQYGMALASPLELSLLHRLTALDDDYRILQLPAVGTRNLITRVIHYRLSLYGIADVSPDAPLDLGLVLLEELNVHLGTRHTTRRLVRLLGHVDGLLQALVRSGRLRRQLIVFKDRKPLTERSPTPDDLANSELVADSLRTDLQDSSTDVLAGARSLDGALLPDLPLSARTLDLLAQEESRELHRLTDELAADNIEASPFLSARDLTTEARTRQQELTDAQARLQQLEQRIAMLQQQQADDWQEMEAKITELLARRPDLLLQLERLEDSRRALQLERRVLRQQLRALPDASILTEQIQQLAAQLREHTSESLSEWVAALPQRIARLESQMQSLLDEMRRPGLSSAQKQDIQQQLKALQKARQPLLSLQQQADRLQKLRDQLAEVNDLPRRQEAVAQALDELRTEAHSWQERLARLNNQIEQLRQLRAAATTAPELQSTLTEAERLRERIEQLQRRINDLVPRFRRRLRKSVEQPVYELALQHLDAPDTAAARAYFEQQRTRNFNRFVVRLLQVVQWTGGHYYGKLDGVPGNRTLTSIKALSQVGDKVTLRFVLHLTATGYWVFNGAYFMDKIQEYRRDMAAQAPAFDTAADEYEAALTEGTPTESIMNDAFEKSVQQYSQDLQQGTGRRIYLGFLKLCRGIGRVVRRIVQIVVKGVRLVVRLFANLVQVLYREIREGCRLFASGMGFLLGRRRIETTSVSGGTILHTRFDFDCDVVSIVQPRCPSESLTAHCGTCGSRTDALHFALVLTGRIIKYVIGVTTGLSWARLALRIAMEFRKHIVGLLVRGARAVARV